MTGEQTSIHLEHTMKTQSIVQFFSDFFAVFGNHAAIRLPSGPHSFVYRYVRHEAGQTTYEHYSSGAVVQRTTPSKTISFDGTVTISMESGKTYKFEGRGIVIDTSGSYQQMP